MTDHPHIIIFNPDEMRADTMGHLGNPAARTPNLDAFARREAVSFANAYCQNPVCVPSRCSFFTGLYPHVHGHRTMSYLLRPGEKNLFSQLKAAGYSVWMNDRNDLCAAQYPGWVESQADTVFSAEGPAAPGPLDRQRRGGPGGKYYYSHFEGQLGLDAQGRNYSRDDEAVDAAIARIGQWKAGDAPLCLFLGLLFPHPPYEVEEPWFSAVDRGRLPPRIRWEDCRGKSLMMELIHRYQNLEGLDEQEWDELRAVYLGMCAKVDDQFGRLCGALRRAGIYDDCAIFFLSDHGDFAGDYGMAEKAQNCFEDCLTRVPLLVKPPAGTALDAGVSQSLVELVDFYATALDFAGLPPDREQFGRSLRPVLADRTAAIRQVVFCEGGRRPGETQCDEYHQENGEVARQSDVYWPKKMAQADDEAHAKATMARDSRYKYIHRSAGRDELYDLETDPAETDNRIDDPALAPARDRLRAAMLDWLQTTSDVVPCDYDRRMTDGRLWGMVRHLVPAGAEEQVRARIREGIGIGALFGYCIGLQKAADRPLPDPQGAAPPDPAAPGSQAKHF